MTDSFEWTEENTETAVGLYNSGCTLSEIAEIISAPSRNVIAGKLKRLGVQGRVRKKLKLRVDESVNQVRQSDHQSGNGVSFERLGAKMCRWPVATCGQVHFFCGCETDGSVYCEEHKTAARLTDEDL